MDLRHLDHLAQDRRPGPRGPGRTVWRGALTRLGALVVVIAVSRGPVTEAWATDELADQPCVYERVQYRSRFEDDGSSRAVVSARIRVRTESGVRALGDLVFGFRGGSERVEIRFARVMKPDGSVVTASADSIHETTAAVAREAPVFSDVREVHVTVPGLRPGDTLEYEVERVVERSPLAGQFSLAFRFKRMVATQDARVEVDVPRARDPLVRWSASAGRPDLMETGARRVYRWKWSWTAPADIDSARRRNEQQDPFDIQVTSFRRWEDLGAAWATLLRDRVEPSSDVSAKAAALTKGLTNAREKVGALYDFVSREIRYVAVELGKSSYQPHSASETLANRYGDCKDKHVLLAAMLRARGIESAAVLAGVESMIDPELPNLSALDHVFTAVALDGETVWLDTTPEVAPFGWVSPFLRGKKVLVVPPRGSSWLAETVGNGVVPSGSIADVDTRYDASGSFTGRLRLTFCGDAEVGLRMLLRHGPNALLAESVLKSLGIDGESTAAHVSDPWDTHQPLLVDVHFRSSKPLDPLKDWQLRLPAIYVQHPRAGSEKQVQLGGPARVVVRYRAELPPGRVPRAPPGDRIERDFAEYRATYGLEGNVIVAERTFTLSSRELPMARVADFESFLSDVERALEKALFAEREAVDQGVTK